MNTIFTWNSVSGDSFEMDCAFPEEGNVIKISETDRFANNHTPDREYDQEYQFPEQFQGITFSYCIREWEENSSSFDLNTDTWSVSAWEYDREICHKVKGQVPMQLLRDLRQWLLDNWQVGRFLQDAIDELENQ